MAREDASAALEDPELAPLARVASDLRRCPSPAFYRRLRTQLQRRTLMSTVLEHVTVREGFKTVTPYLRAEDARLVGFLTQTFAAVETLSHPAGPGMTHREVRIGDSMLMIGEGGTIEREARRPQAFHVFVEDVDAAFERAIAAGGSRWAGSRIGLTA